MARLVAWKRMRGDLVLRALLAAIALLLTATSPGAAPALPEGWVVYPTPSKPDACEWMRANYSRQEWRVRLDSGRVTIADDGTPLPPRYPEAPKFDIHDKEFRGPIAPRQDRILRVEDGWLVGFDFGEWGGRLWWTDADGRNATAVPDAGRCADIRDSGPKRFEMDGWRVTNVRSLQRAGDLVLVVTGLAHLGLRSGEVSRAERKGGKWRTCLVRNLDAAPYVATFDDPGRWLVLTTSGLVRVRTDGALERVADFVFLNQALYPNSMVKLADGTLYVGMRHFVARLLPQAGGGYREELLVPANRPPFAYEPLIDDRSKSLVPRCAKQS